jgi:hypothetical protein
MASWAIVVGINQYPAAGPGLSNLSGAVSDAVEFAEWALHPGGGNVEPKRLLFWGHPWPQDVGQLLDEYLKAQTDWWHGGPVQPNPNRPPTLSEIVQSAAKMASDAGTEELAQGEPGRCFVFLAGHGVQGRTQVSPVPQTCFVAGDHFPSPISNGLLPADDLRIGLLTTGFREVHLFLDCCRRSLVRANAIVPTLAFPGAIYPNDAAWTASFASGRNGIAWETPRAHPTRGAFSKILLQGLWSVRNAQGVLTVRALEDYVVNRIAAAVHPDQQAPLFIGEPATSAHVLLTGPAIPLNFEDVTVDLSALAENTLVNVKDKDGVLQVLQADGTPKAVALEVGQMYSLETQDRSRVKAFLHQGGEMHVQL